VLAGEGYQRTLSQGRVRQVARYLKGKGVIPGSIVVSFKAGKYDAAKKALVLPNSKNIGWIIDGQHRLAGAHEASRDGKDILSGRRISKVTNRTAD